MKTNIKLRVTPEQSEAVQKICFANDFTWLYNPQNIALTGIGDHFLGIKSDYTLLAAGSKTCFTEWLLDEVDADLFIRTKGTCEEPIDIVDNLSNNKSKEDMFKQYGFEVPDFDCTILAKVNNDYIGYATIPSSTIVALSWNLNGIAYMGVTHTPQYNLAPIKKPWYETCKFPILVMDTSTNKLEIATHIINNTLYLLSDIKDISEVRPLSNNEIDQLKHDF